MASRTVRRQLGTAHALRVALAAPDATARQHGRRHSFGEGIGAVEEGIEPRRC